ncbi:chemotaxis protein CheA [Evansella clarkii]|uniref:chemotaxis protein CheA n=1 Tax=Evansella clarkii TaxID=79879 RepID=UPI00099814C9|nr:chemotaxis protein CheA [Evansella clarkii]
MEKNQYLDMFIEESKEHLQAMNTHFLKLEEEPGNISLINEVFRSAHTLKGMAATMGFYDLEKLTHQLENILDGIRNGVLNTSAELLDMMFESVDDLEAMVEDISAGGEGKRNVTEIIAALKKLEEGAGLPSPQSTALQEAASTAVPEEQTIILDDFELTVIAQSEEQGFEALQIDITLQENCVLKAARVFMVFEALEKSGEIIKASPSVDELEEEKFENSFTVILVTKSSSEEVKSSILNISEIESAEVTKIFTGKIQTEEDKNADKEPENSVDEEMENDLPRSSEDSSRRQARAQSANKTIRVNIDRLDTLMNLFEELVIDRGRLEQISRESNNSELTETVEHMTRVSGDLQSIILNLRMVPAEQVFNRFPRMVRSLAKELNKKAVLTISGEDTELDRNVIDEIGDPLVHLLRNSLDHGIERPEDRIKAGKDEAGKINLLAYHSGNHVFIEVSDDGAGINKEKVLEKALKNGVINKGDTGSLSETEVFELLFASGFSTAEKVSNVSGRGVGLDVVKNKIESLGGSVSVESEKNKGTKFTVRLPLTLSIIPSLLVKIQEETFAIPLSSIIETAIIKDEDILSAHKQKVIDFRGKVIPLLDLTGYFDVPVSAEASNHLHVVIVRVQQKIAALVVNQFIGQQEIVLKSLGNYLSAVPAISGATILGNGQIALIIDCNSIMQH